MAISGETASFLAGGEFPIPVPQGNQQVTIDFREFGVRLNFTPIVRGQQLIRLRVAPELSELDFSTAVQIEGFVVPGLTTRSTETTVELTSGQTIAIAGLLNEQVRGLASRVPGVGDVPVLGRIVPVGELPAIAHGTRGSGDTGNRGRWRPTRRCRSRRTIDRIRRTWSCSRWG